VDIKMTLGEGIKSIFNDIMRFLEWVTKSKWVFMALFGSLATSGVMNYNYMFPEGLEKISAKEVVKTSNKKVTPKIIYRSCDCRKDIQQFKNIIGQRDKIIKQMEKDIIDLKEWHR